MKNDFHHFSGEGQDSTTIYKQAATKVEKMVAKAETMMFKIAVPLFAFPKMIGSYIEYYIFGASESCFQLTFDMS